MSTEFFAQLQAFSDRFVQAEFGMRVCVSAWGHPQWARSPLGAVIHFTADEDHLRVLRWFLEKRFGAKASRFGTSCWPGITGN